MEGIRRTLVLGLVLIAGTTIEQAPSVGTPIFFLACAIVTVYMYAIGGYYFISGILS